MNQVVATKNEVTPGDQPAGYSGGSCAGHFREKMAVDAEGHCVYLSSSRGHGLAWSKPDAQQVDFGVYLDSGWKYDLQKTTSDLVISENLPDDVRPPQEVLDVWTKNYSRQLPGIYFPWTDGQAVDLLKLDALMEWINPLITAGKKIEIACIGGHGRTGTLVAAIILYRNPEFTPKAVITAVRNLYCNHAVETYAQIKCLYEFVNLQPPPQATKVWTPSNKATGGSSTNSSSGAATLSSKELGDIRVALQKGSVKTLGLNWTGLNLRKEVTQDASESGPNAFTNYSLD